jgi:hypothetical protein
MIEAGASSTEEVVAVLSEVSCAPHRGSHGRTTRGPAQRAEGVKRRPRDKGKSKKRGQEHYKGRDPALDPGPVAKGATPLA